VIVGQLFSLLKVSNKEIVVSVMCKMNKLCNAEKGLCIHEKMMLGIMILSALAAVGHWVLRLF
jgi:hypothetical protein